MKVSSDVFHIWFLSFNYSTDSVNEFVPDIVYDEHLVLSFLDFPQIVGSYTGVVVYYGECTNMQVLFKCSVGHVITLEFWKTEEPEVNLKAPLLYSPHKFFSFKLFENCRY